MKTLQQQIIELDYIATGSIIKKFGTCGKKGCNCASDKKYWHGPYYVWTRKENGKTVTKSLSVEQVKLCENAIENMKKLKSLVTRWQRETLNVIDAMRNVLRVS
jgi:hypothetical protein